MGDCELTGPVNTDEQVELAFSSLNLGDVDMEEAYGVSFELLALWLVALDIASNAESLVEGHKDNRPAATRCAV